MPLDAMYMPRDYGADALQAQYKQRRESAARLWESIPDRKFLMQRWEQHPFNILGTQFGYAACALGWLAEKQHDGWRWRSNGSRVPQGPDGKLCYSAAESYFGLFLADADRCFGASGCTASIHGRWFTSRVTGKDVGRTLLKLPYKLPTYEPTWYRPCALVEVPELAYT